MNAMTERTKRIKPTPEIAARMRKAIAEESRPEVMAANRELGRKLFETLVPGENSTAAILRILLNEKRRQQLSLADLESKTGITRSNLSRLWNQTDPNVTLETVERIAKALNCRLRFGLEPISE
jgi:DNA-binding Xre family transcriptional regulator